MSQETNIVLAAYGPAASGKTYILRKVKEYLEDEGFDITGPMEIREGIFTFTDESKEVLFIGKIDKWIK